MCQLLGIISNRAVDCQFSLREFRHRGEDNLHGWGFAFLENDKWKIIKEPDRLKNADNKKFDFKSKIIIGHVRLKSCGPLCHENTHPFGIDDWVFAHNGTVSGIIGNPDFKLTKYKPAGGTDSEYAFCYIMECLKDANDPEKEIKNAAEKIKEYGNFNFLLSNDKVLYAYGDSSLFYTERKAPFEFAKLKDDGYEVNLADIKGQNEKAVIIATEPLTTNERWKKIEGLMKVVNGGIEGEVNI